MADKTLTNHTAGTPATGTLVYVVISGNSRKATADDLLVEIGKVVTFEQFTSTGIDDNATGERLQISDGDILIGDASSAEDYLIGLRGVTDGIVRLSGGNTGAVGANVVLYGSTHASAAGDFLIRTSTTNIIAYDHSATQLAIRVQAVLGGGVSAAQTSIVNSHGDGELQIAGGTTVGAGANLRLFGGSHATLAYDWALRAGSTNVLYWDHSATLLTLTGALSVSNALTVLGAFTSLGIDDNASGERLQIADSLLSLGSGASQYVVAHANDTTSLIIAGGSSGTSGGNLLAYGGTHATLAGDWALRSGSTNQLYWDESADSLAITSTVLQWNGGDILVENVEGQGPVTGGASVTVKDQGTISSGTLTPSPGARYLHKATNNGAFTLAPHGSLWGDYRIDITNGASAGAITTSGWTVVSGDSFDTTNGHKFACFASITDAGSVLQIVALQ